MTFLRKFWHGFCNIFGFHRNSKYVDDYLDTANMRSGIFMSVVIIALEIYLVIRQTDKYVLDALFASSSVKEATITKVGIELGEYPFYVLFTNLSSYFLLMSLGGAMLFYCLQFSKKEKSKKKFVSTLAFAGVSLALCLLMPFEFRYGSIKFISTTYKLRGILKIVFYGSIIAFDVSVVLATIEKYKNGKLNKIYSIVTISTFALVCLTFGVMISYGDYVSTAKFTDTGVLQHKQIICFLTMILYVACLLIWKPYISISILGSIFLLFYFALKYFGGDRQLPEGDEINYLTFFISLTMVAISIYNQRIREANKDEELEEMATKDKLTGLYSYRYFLQQCKEKINSENLKGGEYVYLFLNLRHFKIFNDQKGYFEGNQLLKDVGKIFQECFDEGTLLTRQSDDHFMAFTKTGRIVEKVDKAAEMILQRTPIVRVGLNVGACLLLDTLDEPQVGVEKARYACT